jgi:Xaa-Pro aminopeptidase
VPYLAIPAVLWGESISVFQARRMASTEKVADGIILLHANSGMKQWEDAGFHQEPNFYYFSGLRNAQGAILAIDGATKESWLFVQPKPNRYQDLHGLDAVFPASGVESQAELKIEHVAQWDAFGGWIDSRRSSNPSLAL